MKISNQPEATILLPETEEDKQLLSALLTSLEAENKNRFVPHKLSEESGRLFLWKI
jgi:hypothetical protein